MYQTDDPASERKTCPKCNLQGISSPVQLFQLNDDEAIWMCKNVECTFMPSSDWSTLVVKRRWEDIPVSGLRKSAAAAAAAGLSKSSVFSSAPQSGYSSLQSRHQQFVSATETSVAGGDSANTSSGYFSSQSSRAPSPVESECGDQGHKSLVPIGPFLAPGSAHTFSSFQTGRIESERLAAAATGRGADKSTYGGVSRGKKRVTSKTAPPQLPENHPYRQQLTHSAHPDVQLPLLSSSRHSARKGGKRSHKSPDSDSVSSSSTTSTESVSRHIPHKKESVSRPASPVIIDTGRGLNSKVRKIYVTSDTLHKIKKGDKKALKTVLDINKSLPSKIRPASDSRQLNQPEMKSSQVSAKENGSHSSDIAPDSSSSSENVSQKSEVYNPNLQQGLHTDLLPKSQGYHTYMQKESQKCEVAVDNPQPQFDKLLKNIHKQQTVAIPLMLPKSAPDPVDRSPFINSHLNGSGPGCSQLPLDLTMPKKTRYPIIEATPVFSAENLSDPEFKEKFSSRLERSFAGSPEIAAHTKAINFHIAAINAALACNSSAVVIQPNTLFPNSSLR